MADREKIQAAGISKNNREFLYYIKDGKVFRVPKKRPGVPKGQPEVEYDAGLSLDPDYMYFVDEDGDISRVPRAKGALPGRKTHRKASRKAAAKKSKAEKPRKKKVVRKAKATRASKASKTTKRKARDRGRSPKS